MHFFHPIQQSALHIYHSALPLSPKSSTFRSGILQDKTLFAELPECPDTWGAVIRTIKANSGRFTSMTTFSHRIAAASDDGTVGVYDSITGALRLSLSPPDPVRMIKGSPDGSMLFCAHQGPSITVWDIQTGGLIHTFVLETQAEDIAVSLTGRYLACGLSGGVVKVWEVANNTEVGTRKSCSPLSRFCWLEPGEQLVIANGASVRVWDVVSRKGLRSFTINGSAYGVVFTQRLNKFAILAASEVGNTVTIVDSRTGTSFTDATPQRLSCFAFSQTTKELVCGTNDPGLELFNISVREWRQFHHPAAITSVSTLSSGFVVANVPGSGIQFLSPDEVYTQPQQPTTPAIAVHGLDQDDIIAATLNSRDSTTLLELATLSPILPTIPLRTQTIAFKRSQILCTSLKHRIVVRCFDHHGKTRLELWKFGDEAPTWTHDAFLAGLVGAISPSGSRLVALDGDRNSTYVRMWDTENGGKYRFLPVRQPWPSHVLEIKFESEDQFYSQHEGYRIPFTISSPSANTYSITRHEQLPSPNQRYYDVDNAREWVVSFSKRICWIPPGYIGSAENSYCWAGNALVMVGQDGVLRKLSFREPT